MRKISNQPISIQNFLLVTVILFRIEKRMPSLHNCQYQFTFSQPCYIFKVYIKLWHIVSKEHRKVQKKGISKCIKRSAICDKHDPSWKFYFHFKLHCSGWNHISTVFRENGMHKCICSICKIGIIAFCSICDTGVIA